ncbi:Photosystem I assembly protein Ycf3 [Trifolium repens]|nr:Photosystem I assembly protein Ycf3 [Trifolium repens]
MGTVLRQGKQELAEVSVIILAQLKPQFQVDRSRINGNFIDKTFTIVANILLRIIPTTSGEKEAFTYYRDGAI